ncbi:unnamed protein product [Caretta caretta]
MESLHETHVETKLVQWSQGSRLLFGRSVAANSPGAIQLRACLAAGTSAPSPGCGAGRSSCGLAGELGAGTGSQGQDLCLGFAAAKSDSLRPRGADPSPAPAAASVA